MAINSFTIEGYIGKKPELKTLHDGKTVCNFSIGHTHYVGKGEKETVWINIVTWGNLAEACGKFLDKGSRVVATGKLQVREYTTKQGEKRTVVECVANDVSFPSRKDSEDTRTAETKEPKTLDDLEIPF